MIKLKKSIFRNLLVLFFLTWIFVPVIFINFLAQDFQNSVYSVPIQDHAMIRYITKNESRFLNASKIVSALFFLSYVAIFFDEFFLKKDAESNCGNEK